MKGYRLFAEMPEHRGSKSASKKYDPFDKAHLRELAARGLKCSVVALLLDDDNKPLYSGDMMDAVVREPGGFTLTTISSAWLSKRCIRIEEETARKLCPELFNCLENR